VYNDFYKTEKWLAVAQVRYNNPVPNPADSDICVNAAEELKMLQAANLEQIRAEQAAEEAEMKAARKEKARNKKRTRERNEKKERNRPCQVPGASRHY
jgi:hypothetical protein